MRKAIEYRLPILSPAVLFLFRFFRTRVLSRLSFGLSWTTPGFSLLPFAFSRLPFSFLRTIFDLLRLSFSFSWVTLGFSPAMLPPFVVSVGRVKSWLIGYLLPVTILPSVVSVGRVKSQLIEYSPSGVSAGSEGRQLLKALSLAVLLSFFFPLSEAAAQDSLPQTAASEHPLRKMKPLQELMNREAVKVAVQVKFPDVFRGTGHNEIVDSLAVLTPFLERLRQVHTGLSEDTVRIVHIGDSHVRGHIYPQTAGTRLAETFGAVSYVDMGVNGATSLTFTHPVRIADIAALRPELLIVSFGTNESHNRRYNANVHYRQMDELMQLLRRSLPDVPFLLTTPPGSYDSFRKKRRKRTYAINPRTAIAAETIRRYAGDHQVLLWDMYEVVGGRRRACLNWTEANMMHFDHVHYLPEGYVLQGDLLFQAIIRAYNDYVSN